MRTFLVTVFLFLSAHYLFSQNNSKIDSLKKLGREALIELAIKKISEPTFDPKQYDRVIVKANEKALVIEFRLSITFAGNKSCYFDAVYETLVGNGTGKSIQGDCENPKFYKKTDAIKKKIDFVFNAINKSDEIGHIPNNKLDEGTNMTITEKLMYYYVEMSSWSTYSHYKVDKGSGKISEANHKHYAHGSEDEKPEWEIIK